MRLPTLFALPLVALLAGCAAGEGTTSVATGPAAAGAPPPVTLLRLDGQPTPDQVRRKLLDRCIIGKWSRPGINQTALAGQCQCAATRTVRGMSSDEAAAVGAGGRLTAPYEAKYAEALAACIKS